MVIVWFLWYRHEDVFDGVRARKENELFTTMMTLRQFALEPSTVPMRTTWYLTDLAEARGKQELYTCQSPQKLKALREYALIESAVSAS